MLKKSKFARSAMARVRATFCLVILATAGVLFVSAPSQATPPNSVIVSGTLLDSSGSPKVGVRLQLVAWPNPDELDLLAAGPSPSTSEPMGILDAPYTTASGGYSASYVPNAALATYADSQGLISFELVSSDNVIRYFFSDRIVHSGSSYELVSPNTPLDGSGLPTDGFVAGLVHDVVPLITSGAQTDRTPSTTATSTDTVTGTVVDDATLATPGNSPVVPSAINNIGPDGCTFHFERTYGHPYSIVGQWYSSSYAVTATQTVGASSHTTLGVDTSLTFFGGFTASSTLDVTNPSTLTFSAMNYAGTWYKETQYTYHEMKVTCWGSVHFAARPTGLFGGTQTAYPSGMPDVPGANCAPYHAGDKVDLDSSKAITWKDGVGLHTGIFSADLSSQGGYETNLKLHVNVLGPVWLCGLKDGPQGSPELVEARHTRP